MASRREKKVTKKRLDKMMRDAEIKGLMDTRVVEKHTLEIDFFGTDEMRKYNCKRFALTNREKFLQIDEWDGTPLDKPNVIYTTLIPLDVIREVRIITEFRNITKEEAEKLVDERMRKSGQTTDSIDTA